MNKKIFLIIAIFLVGIFMPKVVFAEEFEQALYIEDATGEHNLLEGDEVENVTYDSETNTLTLNNFEGRSIMAACMDLTIVLEGENSIKDYNEIGFGVEIGTFTIKGNGTLTLESSSDNSEAALAVFGKLIIESGTINIKNNHFGVFVVGDLEINGGNLNIDKCAYGIDFDASYMEYLVDIGISSSFKFDANGGNITINECEQGIIIDGPFRLNGSNITFNDCIIGLSNSEFGISDGNLEFNHGKFIFIGDDEDTDTQALAILFRGDNIDKENLIKFNSTDLYIDDPEFDFRIIDISEDMIAVALAKEGITVDNAFDGYLAKNISILPKKTYKVTEGNGQKIYQKADSIKIDADLDKFVALYINDELVDEANYELESGSTIIKLKEDYTKKLSAGNYKFKVVFTDGVAEGEFTVITENPETGDNIIASILLLLLSLGSLVIINKHSKA